MSHTIREGLAGFVMIALGLAVAFQGTTYAIGTFTQMGPGFFPTALGLILAFVGLLITATAFGPPPEAQLGEHSFRLPDWRGALCIVGAVLIFIALGEYAGLAPAMFVCVVVAAMGDRDMKLWQALALGVGLTVFIIALFVHVLNLPLPLWNTELFFGR